jgi:hypothetical protein
MEHADVQPKLSDYLDHAVGLEEKAAIEGHLAACPDCSKALAELVATRRHVQSLAEVDPPPWLTGKIMARVREQVGQKRGLFQRLFYPLRIKLPMEALGLIFLTVTAYFIFRNIQPEMGPLITPSREVYERAQPLGPKTSTPLESAEEKKQALKKEERSMAGKSVEPAPKMNKAMPLEGSAAKPEETPKRAATPELQAGRRMKLEEMAAKPAERSEMVGKQTAMPAPAAQATRPPLQLTLSAKDAVGAGLRIEEAVTRLGGKTVKKESFENTQLLFVQVDVRKVEELLITLEHLGEVKEKIPPAKEAEGTRVITIKIVPISPSP